MSTRRLGARYGATVRKRVEAIERKKKARYQCPHCKKENLVWIAFGIWECKNCGFKMGGAAFEPVSEINAKFLSVLEQHKKASR